MRRGKKGVNYSEGSASAMGTIKFTTLLSDHLNLTIKFDTSVIII
jgi:hypothetical protein